jgi:hypothetical protein
MPADLPRRLYLEHKLMTDVDIAASFDNLGSKARLRIVEGLRVLHEVAAVPAGFLLRVRLFAWGSYLEEPGRTEAHPQDASAAD